MPLTLNANNSAPVGLSAADEKLDQGQREPHPRDEAAVYASASRPDVSSLASLKASLDRAASNARLAVSAVEQISDLLIQMRQKADGSAAAVSTPDDDHALQQAIGAIAASGAFESGEGGFGLIPRDFGMGGSIVNLGEGTSPSLDMTIGRVTTALSEMDAEAAQIERHVALVTRLQDMVAKRVGSLVDADMNQDAARLEALQIQQQLGEQALSLANSQPQTVLELFRGD